MHGSWAGEGYIMMGPSNIKEFVQEEQIIPKAGGIALLVSGMGYRKDAEKFAENVVHDALGIITYNAEKEK